MPASRIVGLDHVQLAIPRDADSEARARWFYGEVLGLAELPKPAALTGRGGAWFRCGALALHVGLEADHQPARKAHPAFLVTDLEAMRSHLEAAGQPVHTDVQIPGYRRFETHDPFGNRLEFMQRVSSSRIPANTARPMRSSSACASSLRAPPRHTSPAAATRTAAISPGWWSWLRLRPATARSTSPPAAATPRSRSPHTWRA